MIDRCMHLALIHHLARLDYFLIIVTNFSSRQHACLFEQDIFSDFVNLSSSLRPNGCMRLVKCFAKRKSQGPREKTSMYDCTWRTHMTSACFERMTETNTTVRVRHTTELGRSCIKMRGKCIVLYIGGPNHAALATPDQSPDGTRARQGRRQPPCSARTTNTKVERLGAATVCSCVAH